MTITPKRALGDKGEHFAVEFLVKQGFNILDRNYLRKWGEIDIVSQKEGKIHFVEVKSVTRVTNYVGDYRPEDNMHPWKIERLGRAIQTYLLERRIPEHIEWQLDLITVYIDKEGNLIKIEEIQDIIL